MKKKKNNSLYYVTLSTNSLTINYYITKEEGSLTESSVDSIEYPLIAISASELLQHRASGVPGFVLKRGCKLYYTSIPKNLKLLSQEWNHACGANCSNLFPSKCKKVQDLSKKSYFSKEEGKKCSQKALVMSKRIEKYDFITLGFETFNVDQECFTVLKCAHFKKTSEYGKKKLSPSESQAIKLALAQVIWPDINSRAQSRDRYEKNRYLL